MFNLLSVWVCCKLHCVEPVAGLQLLHRMTGVVEGHLLMADGTGPGIVNPLISWSVCAYHVMLPVALPPLVFPDLGFGGKLLSIEATRQFATGAALINVVP